MSFARVLVFAIALTHTVGFADLVFADACEDACEGDGCGKECLPGAACRCHCPSTMPALGSVQAGIKVEPPKPVAQCTYDPQEHASPDPREIVHVPKHVV